MLITRFKLETGTVITPLFNFYLELGLQRTKNYRSVQYTVLLYKITVLFMKIMGNSSHGYQIMNRSRHTITKYLNDEKTYKAVNEPLFQRLNTVEKELYEVELSKSTIEHREPILVGFSILQYTKLRMLSFILTSLTNSVK